MIGAAAGVVAYREATGRTPVVVMERSVSFGQVIELADLREVRLPRDTGLVTVPWDEVDSVVRRVAVSDLAAGTALTGELVRADGPPGADEAVVGLSVGPGRAPTTPFKVRDEVLVIVPDTAAAPLRATVLRPGEPDGTGQETVDLLVNEGMAVDLARAASDDRTVLVLVAGR